jgi:SAM-dependent methyltransferase
MRIDFDAELQRGLKSYEDVLARWWLAQSEDSAHRRAFSRIARYIHDSFQMPLRLVVDYGCGTGALLARLAWRYPDARFLGLDGSAFMLRQAERRIARRGSTFRKRIRLLQTPLPDFDLPGPLADLVVYAFPNIVPAEPSGDFRSEARRLPRGESRILEFFGKRPRSESSYEDQLRDRLIALNLRGLLKRGGYCVRVEYSAARRDELSGIDQLRAGMEEGSLDVPIRGIRPTQWFRLVASSWFRSGVMEDVAHQQGRRAFSGGGYTITVLRAV